MSQYVRWAEKERPESVRIAATLPAGGLFAFLLPLAITKGGPSLDRRFGIRPAAGDPASKILGSLLIILGFYLALWSILVQFTRGRGTPLPLMPTQKLLRDGPFRYCRNPMTLGTLTAYLGMGVLAATPMGIGIVLVFGALLILYLKRFEEKELAERFGPDYLVYKQETPFILPHLPKRA